MCEENVFTSHEHFRLKSPRREDVNVLRNKRPWLKTILIQVFSKGINFWQSLQIWWNHGSSISASNVKLIGWQNGVNGYKWANRHWRDQLFRDRYETETFSSFYTRSRLRPRLLLALIRDRFRDWDSRISRDSRLRPRLYYIKILYQWRHQR